MARLLKLLIVVTLLAAVTACTSSATTRPSPTPTTSASTSPTAFVSGTAEPSATPTTEPSATLEIPTLPPGSALPSSLFPCTTAAGIVAVSVRTPRGIATVRAPLAPGDATAPSSTPAAAASTPAATASASGAAVSAGDLVGSQTYPLAFALDASGKAQPIAATSGTATVSGGGLAAATPASLNVNGSSGAVTLPDGDGAALLTLD